MKEDTSLIEFPCDFKIKIIGENKANYFNEIIAIVRKHYPELKETAIESTPSKQAAYLAISVTVPAKDQKSLDALYLDLSKHPDNKMVL